MRKNIFCARSVLSLNHVSLSFDQMGWVMLKDTYTEAKTSFEASLTKCRSLAQHAEFQKGKPISAEAGLMVNVARGGFLHHCGGMFPREKGSKVDVDDSTNLPEKGAQGEPKRCIIPPPRSMSYLKSTLPPEEFAKLKKPLEVIKNELVLDYFSKETSIVNIYDTLNKPSSNTQELSYSKVHGMPPKEKLKLVKQRFLNLVFFFDCVSSKTLDSIVKLVRELGGKIVLFMTKNVTHLVTDKFEPLSENCSQKCEFVDPSLIEFQSVNDWLCSTPKVKSFWIPKPEKKKAAEGNISIASKFGIKIWPLLSLSKFTHEVFDTHERKTPYKRRLKDCISQENLGLLKRQDLNFLPFNHNYIFLECISGEYAPIYAKEFKVDLNNESSYSWPVFRLKKELGKFAFYIPSKRHSEDANLRRAKIRKTSNEKNSSEKNSSDALNLKNEVIEEKIKASRHIRQSQSINNSHSVASGLVSNFTASNSRTTASKNDSNIKCLGLRELKILPKEGAKNASFSTKASGSVSGKSFYNRPGWCENCNREYDSFRKHVMSTVHRFWAVQISDFKKLDELIEKIGNNSPKAALM